MAHVDQSNARDRDCQEPRSLTQIGAEASLRRHFDGNAVVLAAIEIAREVLEPRIDGDREHPYVRVAVFDHLSAMKVRPLFYLCSRSLPPAARSPP